MRIEEWWHRKWHNSPKTFKQEIIRVFASFLTRIQSNYDLEIYCNSIGPLAVVYFEYKFLDENIKSYQNQDPLCRFGQTNTKNTTNYIIAKGAKYLLRKLIIAPLFQNFLVHPNLCSTISMLEEHNITYQGFTQFQLYQSRFKAFVKQALKITIARYAKTVRAMLPVRQDDRRKIFG